jgi:hypothetical protein
MALECEDSDKVLRELATSRPWQPPAPRDGQNAAAPQYTQGRTENGVRQDQVGDIARVVELNAAPWHGPEADEATGERVRLMQRRALRFSWLRLRSTSPSRRSLICAPSLLSGCGFRGDGPAGYSADRGRAGGTPAQRAAGRAALGRTPAHAGTAAGIVPDADRFLRNTPGRVGR